jgi:hypothetical protein
MYRIHWGYRVAAILSLFAVFCVLGYCTRVPKLGPTEMDNSAQEYRERMNREYSQEAYDRLRQKYGDQ